MLVITGAIAFYTELYLTTKVGRQVMHDLRHTLDRHIQRLSYIEFSDVSFGHVPKHSVFEKHNLNAQPGQLVALVGPTRSGKTTLIGHQPNSVVLQETLLFHKPALKKGAYCQRGATREEIINAADHDFWYWLIFKSLRHAQRVLRLCVCGCLASLPLRRRKLGCAEKNQNELVLDF